MRHLFVLFMFICCGSIVHAQTTSDCDGAISVCDGFYEETTAPMSTGSDFEIPFTSCNTGEFNSVWYVFTVQEDGFLSFVLDPAVGESDYDWGLYDISNNGCAGISSGASPEVSCNSWGVIGVNGPTGISTANGGIGNSNGPGDLLGPPFNEDLPVTAGTTFALAVMNWSASLDGYTLDFAESTASIYDDLPPSIISITPNCSGSEIIVTFSESVVVASMELNDFSLEGPGGLYALGAFEAESGATATMDDAFIFSLNDPLIDSGDYTLILEEGADFVQDPCGNTATGSFVFQVSGLMTFDYMLTAACNGGGGIMEVVDLSGGIAPYEFSLNGDIQTGIVFVDLSPGDYDVTLEDSQGCSLTLSAVIENFILTVDAGQDTVLCAMGFFLEATNNAGNFEWSVPMEVMMNESSDPLSFVSSTIPGVFDLIATAQLNECEVSDMIQVTFSVPLNPMIEVVRASCFDFCDGTVDIFSNAGTISAFVNDNTLSGDSIHFDGLCAGSYDLLVTDFAGCHVWETISIVQPPEIIASFVASPQPAEVPETTIHFESISINDSLSHWFFGNPLLGEAFDTTATFVFPQGVGGVYQVTLVVTDGYGCVDSVMNHILIEDNFSIYAPNAFTPDNDDINDVFGMFFSYEPQEYELVILNRWGQPVFMSENFQEQWTGNVLGSAHYAENGVYNWILGVRGNEPDKRTLMGVVTLFR